MLRQSIVRSSCRLATSVRPFSVSARILAEGDLGGGRVGSDSFSKREMASENQYVREQELQKLRALANKLREQKKNITELEADIAAMMEDDDSKHGGKK